MGNLLMRKICFLQLRNIYKDKQKKLQKRLEYLRESEEASKTYGVWNKDKEKLYRLLLLKCGHGM